MFIKEGPLRKFEAEGVTFYLQRKGIYCRCYDHFSGTDHHAHKAGWVIYAADGETVLKGLYARRVSTGSEYPHYGTRQDAIDHIVNHSERTTAWFIRKNKEAML